MTFSVTRFGEVLSGLGSALPVPATGFCIGLSGGLDSTTLLHAAAALRGAGGISALRALHVDHGWSSAAPEWARRCVAAAEALGVPCAVVRVDGRGARGRSPEATARAARYGAFADALRRNEVLLTAHNADDQLETALLQWIRGGGLRALAAMPAAARFGPGWHWRPLLGFERAEIHEWAVAAGLSWIDDPSNADPRYDRSYIRHEIATRLRSRWPAAARTIARVATYAREAVDLEDELAAEDLAAIAEGRTLALERLHSLPPVRQRAVVRLWLRSCRLAVPEARTLAALLRDANRAAADRVPVTRWPGVAVHRYRGRLYAIPASPPARDFAAGRLRAGERIELAPGMALEWQQSTGAGLSRARLPAELAIAHRSGGERFREFGAPHSKPLRKWLQDRGVVPWQRAAIPLLTVGDRVIAVGDLAYGAEFAATPEETSWRLVWVARPELFESDFISARADIEVA